MEDIIFSEAERETRRKFIQKTLLGVSGFTIGSNLFLGCSKSRPAGMSLIGRDIAITKNKRPSEKKDKSILSFVTGTDTRDAAYSSLKPLEDTVTSAIENKQVVIKPNTGVVGPNHHHEVADVEQLRGILDFLQPIYNKQIIIAEGTAAQAVSMHYGFEEYGYTRLEREYNVRLVDANDLPSTTHWILAGYLRPQPINLIDMYFNPNVYLISACRMKTSGGVLVTLSIKNIAMGAPLCHYKLNKNGKVDDLTNLSVPRGINEKANMHGGVGSMPGRELSYNIFTVASMGGFADLAVLDGVNGADGNGPWSADPVEHGVAVASNDCVAADKFASGLMGVDYDNLPYIKWCAQAGIGRDDLNDVHYFGSDYRPHIRKYRLNRNYEKQVQWIRDLNQNLSK
ncbi:MAG: DUF362 domain-containing protein [Candidatus Latescibacteria bacterium]|nr:DUF362 domain-containing protein [Candidatus Latescibacterota bacterium]